MGCAVASAAAAAGHDVTILIGPTAVAAPQGCSAVPFVSVADLHRELAGRFEQCDVLIMAAAVGDFLVDGVAPRKIARSGGPFTIRLVPTDDILATVAAGKRGDQVVVAFAVEDGPPAEIEAKVRVEMAAKSADYTVVNTPEAIAARESYACVLSPAGVVLPWGNRTKEDLAAQIVRLL